MIKTETKKKLNIKNIKIMPYIAGILVSVLAALSLIFVFALIIRYAKVPDKLITPINIVIKILSILAGVFVATKDGTKGLLKGVIIGICFTFCCQIIFSIIARSFSVSIMFLFDILIGIATGALSGILFVNLRKN